MKISVDNTTPMLLLPISIILLSAIIITLNIQHHRIKYMRLFFWIFVYLMFGLAPLVQISGKWPLGGYIRQSDLAYAYVLLWIGLFSYEFFYYFSTVIKHKKQVRRLVEVKTLGSSLLPGVIAYGLSSFIIIFLLLHSIDFFSFRVEFLNTIINQFGTVGSAFIRLCMWNFPLICILWLITDIKHLSLSRNTKILYIILISLLSINILISSNPTISPRWWLGTLVFSMLIIIMRRSYVKLHALISILLPVSYTFLFPFFAYFRSEQSSYDLRLAYSSGSLGIENLSKGDFDSLQQLINTIIYVKEEGVTYGYQLLGIITFWIPRAWWVAKPPETGPLVASYHGYVYTNLSAPLWAEGYINFGIIGVFLFLGIWGYISAKLDNLSSLIIAYPKRYKNLRWVLPCVAALAPAQQLLLRGSLQVSTQYILPMVLIIYIFQGLSLLYRKLSVHPLSYGFSRIH
ncbi:MAG: hypothetical protein QME21_02655 [Anaerolineales bacterium]|nr:hypothetical protein [Anaerolineales bacterium]